MGSSDIKGGPAILCDCIPTKIEKVTDMTSFSIDFEFGDKNYVLGPRDYLVADDTKKPEEL